MISRRTLLAVTPAVLAFTGNSIAAADEPESLRQTAQRKARLFGCATANYQLHDADFATACARECAILVPEYELKRHIVEPSPGHYDFSGADRLLTFAHNHGMAFRGHPLVWHKANPDWLADALAKRDEKVLTDYIARVAGHYRGHMHSWDVVNEALAPLDGRSDGLRKSAWLDAFGPAYIDIAFHAARAADPKAMLVYNDWGCEAGAPENDRFRAATLNFLEAALKRRVPIEALGLQGHLAAFGAPVDQRKLARFCDDVAALGLRILVTEHDVDDRGGPSDIALRDRAVADTSRRFLEIMLAHKATVAVLTWGLSDRYIQAPYVEDFWRWNARSLPLDAQMRRTPMYGAMSRSFAGASRKM